MLPAEAFQVTDLLVVVPATAAANWIVPPSAEEAVLGEMEIELTVEPDGELAAGCGWTTAAHPERIETPRMIATESADVVLSARR